MYPVFFSFVKEIGWEKSKNDCVQLIKEAFSTQSLAQTKLLFYHLNTREDETMAKWMSHKEFEITTAIMKKKQQVVLHNWHSNCTTIKNDKSTTKNKEELQKNKNEMSDIQS